MESCVCVYSDNFESSVNEYHNVHLHKIIFEEIYGAGDPSTLMELKELSARRRAIEESINETSVTANATAREMAGGLTSRLEQVIILPISHLFLAILGKFIYVLFNLCLFGALGPAEAGSVSAIVGKLSIPCYLVWEWWFWCGTEDKLV